MARNAQGVELEKLYRATYQTTTIRLQELVQKLTEAFVPVKNILNKLPEGC
jgi:hypothetical protein